MSDHLKRITAPRSWNVGRKSHFWATKPAPGPHSLEGSVPLVMVLRDYLHVCDNAREARRVLAPGGAAMFVDVVSHANPAMDMHLQAIELLRDPSHVRNYRPDEWAAALGGAGFALVTMRARRLRMDFAAWIARMRTSPTHVAAIRSLQKLASANIADHFQIEPDGSFTLDTMVIEAR